MYGRYARHAETAKERGNIVTKNHNIHMVIIALTLTFGFVGCAEFKQRQKNLKRIKYNKEWEMRQNWNNFEVYKIFRPSDSFQRGAAAFLYKIKDDKVILLDNRWIPVTTEELKARTNIHEGVWSAEIRGYNEELYGYLIYRGADLPSVRIIDEKTVRLSYHYNRNYSQ